MRRPVVAALLGLLVLLAGCAAMPQSGPVSRGIEAAPEPEAISLVAEDPQPGDTPEQTVRGFLAGAAAGTTDDYTVARRYLTPEAAEGWTPGAQVAIYSGGDALEVQEVGEGQVEVSVTLSATVDASGVYTPAPPESTTTVTFGLERNERGHWRIGDVSDGVLVSEVIFGSQYRQIPLYFFTADASMLVPDVRWFPQRNAPTAAIRALLDGPVPWLATGVFSAIPVETSLSYGAVPVSSGTASVDLTSEALRADATARQMIRAQIERTLLTLSQVQRVEIGVDDAPWDAPMTGSDFAVDPSVGRNPVVLGSESLLLGTFAESSEEPVNAFDDAVPLDFLAVGRIAIAYQGEQAFMLSEPSNLVTVPTAMRESISIVRGENLVAPSYDRHGWVWTGLAANEGALIVARADQTVAEIPAEVLAGTELIALRVSRDGARIALIYQADEEVIVEVGAVQRDEDGNPVRVREGTRIAPQLQAASDVVWVDEQFVAILGVSGFSNTVHLSPVGGVARPLLTVPDAVAIASGRGQSELYVLTGEGDLYGRSGLGWRQVGAGIEQVAFPG